MRYKLQVSFIEIAYMVTLPLSLVRVQSIVISMSVCLSVCSCVSKTIRPNFTKFSVHVTCGHGSVRLWWQCNMLCTSCFVDDIMFLYNEWNRPE